MMKQNIAIMSNKVTANTRDIATLHQLLCRIQSSINNREISEITYSNLINKINNKQLIPNELFVISDYQTKYIQPGPIKDTDRYRESPVEHLVVMALTKSSISRHAISLEYPEDIIEYNIDNNICEDGIRPRPGFIEHRLDTKRNISCPQDWRTMKWARYAATAEPIPPEGDDVLTVKNYYQGLYNDDNSDRSLSREYIFFARQPFVSSEYTDSLIPIVPIDCPIWTVVDSYENESFRGLIYNIESKQEFLTFDCRTDTEPIIKNILIGNTNGLHNNVFVIHRNDSRAHIIENIQLGINCTSNTFYDYYESIITGSYMPTPEYMYYDINIGSDSHCNTFLSTISVIEMGNHMFMNVFNGNSFGITMHSLCRYNRIGIVTKNTEVYATCRNGGMCRMIDIGNTSCWNNIGANTFKITMGSSCVYNTINRSSNTSFANGVSYNVFSGHRACTFGNLVSGIYLDTIGTSTNIMGLNIPYSSTSGICPVNRNSYLYIGHYDNLIYINNDNQEGKMVDILLYGVPTSTSMNNILAVARSYTITDDPDTPLTYTVAKLNTSWD